MIPDPIRKLAVLVLLLASAACGRKAVAPPTAPAEGPIRLLLAGDPFAMALESARPELEKRWGGRIALEIVGYQDARALALLNARDERSRYDLVSFDGIWIGEFHKRGVLAPLEDRLATSRRVSAGDFPAAYLALGRYEGRLLGLPFQPHAELLWVRTDLFGGPGQAAPPLTTDELLAAAARLHDPAQGLYGICWNAQRGQPLGQSMCHFFAAFGQALLDAQGRPAFDTERGLAAARYALALLAYSPPDILSMAWDQRISRFSSGQAAMTYGWAARAWMAEDDPSSRVVGKVAYFPAPHAPGVKPVTPMGMWALGIPAKLDPAGTERAWTFLEWLLQAENQRLLSQHGHGALPLRALLTDPDLRARHPALATLSALGERGQLGAAMRPEVPQWDALCEILGTEFHDMLQGRLTPEEALARAATQADALFATPIP